MKITETTDGKCPQCEVPLRNDECPECYWQPGAELSACDDCRVITDDLVETADGHEYCTGCAKEGVAV
ncbi:hypothetical protein [Alicyclobacillus dauci]|uniref:Double zinc ribbon n=1 Tax=Alicyclobacillus dauci TaxID=1475485 RepID=A0ABY6YXP1_9BACL|nr:hypothetical protein [Alicyclobacillus dauci]WAH35008.1 hypothetical protein NZD86_11770 [Alicyclobacillus dauci]